MLRILARPAFVIDRWLHEHIGHAYGIMLSTGLIADIVHRILDAPSHVRERHHLVTMALAIVMELGLLLHQIGEIYERVGGEAD